MSKLRENSLQTWIIVNDLQIPWHDKAVTSLVLEFIRDLKPHGVVLNGDIVDCYQISDFDKDPKRVHVWTLKEEIRLAGELMDALRDVPEKWWLGGNHEDRLRRLGWRYPALSFMLDFPNLFKLPEHGFAWKPYGGSINLGKLEVTHGFIVRSASGVSAKAHFDRIGSSVLHGHTHRLGTYYRTNHRGAHVAVENGCLCRLNPEYVQHPDWQQGFSVVHVGPRGFFSVQQIPVLNSREFLYGKERYQIRANTHARRRA